jgi:hypothetical protein
MTKLAPIDLREAAIAVAVANTPIFLARRLRENPALKRAYDLHGSAKIFAALRELTQEELADIEQATEAYFYLVALSLDNDTSWLRKAKAFLPQDLKWFETII